MYFDWNILVTLRHYIEKKSIKLYIKASIIVQKIVPGPQKIYVELNSVAVSWSLLNREIRMNLRFENFIITFRNIYKSLGRIFKCMLACN